MPGSINEEQVFAWQIGTAGLTVDYRILHWNGLSWDSEAIGTLTEITGALYEVKFTPDAAGFWLALAYYTLDLVRYDYGLIYFIGMGVEQDNYDLLTNVTYGLAAIKTIIDAVALEATLAVVDGIVDNILIDTGITIPAQISGLNNISTAEVYSQVLTALSANDLDHLMKVAHVTGVPVINSLLDYIMNKDGGQTFARATDSLEALHEDNLIPTVDGVTNTLIKHVLGGKADTAAAAINNTSSLMRYVKMLVTDWLNGGRLDLLIDDIRTRLSIQTADNVSNVYVKDAVGNKADTLETTIRTDKSIIAYVKGLQRLININYDSSAVVGDIDGSVLEVLNAMAGATWTSESLKAIYDLLDAILDLTETGGTLTATGVENSIYLANAPSGVWEPRTVSINLSLMQAGDTVQIKVYERNISGGALTLVAGGPLLLYSNVQSIPMFTFPLNPNRWGVQVTLEQTAGTNRDYDWEVLYSG